MNRYSISISRRAARAALFVLAIVFAFPVIRVRETSPVVAEFKREYIWGPHFVFDSPNISYAANRQITPSFFIDIPATLSLAACVVCLSMAFGARRTPSGTTRMHICDINGKHNKWITICNADIPLLEQISSEDYGFSFDHLVIEGKKADEKVLVLTSR